MLSRLRGSSLAGILAQSRLAAALQLLSVAVTVRRCFQGHWIAQRGPIHLVTIDLAVGVIIARDDGFADVAVAVPHFANVVYGPFDVLTLARLTSWMSPPSK